MGTINDFVERNTPAAAADRKPKTVKAGSPTRPKKKRSSGAEEPSGVKPSPLQKPTDDKA